MRIILAAVALLALTACESHWVQMPDEQHDVTVTHVKRPKRLRVDLRVNETGDLIESIYVAKRCRKWQQVPVGSSFPLNFKVYRHKESGEYSLEPDTRDLRSRFCD